MRPELSPEKQAWVDEVMSRAKPLTAHQLEVIRSELRRVAIEDRVAA